MQIDDAYLEKLKKFVEKALLTYLDQARKTLMFGLVFGFAAWEVFSIWHDSDMKNNVGKFYIRCKILQAWIIFSWFFDIDFSHFNFPPPYLFCLRIGCCSLT